MYLRLASEARFPVEELVTRSYTIEQANDALADLRDGRILERSIIRFQPQPDYAQSSAWSCGFLGSRASSPRTGEGPPWSGDARDPWRPTIPRGRRSLEGGGPRNAVIPT